MKINRINLVKEKTICADEVIYKSMSPIVVRSHSGDNKKTWYYSLNDKKGEEVFLSNLKYQLKDAFGEDRILDFEELEIEVLHNKEVKVKNYGIEVLGNVCRLKIKGKPYILDYLYKAGIGSQKSSGFGMVDLL
jgi:CRISPR-associated endoribonuclease Cas6